jgi:hypothetical protein
LRQRMVPGPEPYLPPLPVKDEYKSAGLLFYTCNVMIL